MSEFARWEGRFASPDYVFGTAPNAFLKSKAALLRPGMRALSIADGEGRNGVWLAEQGLRATSVDFSPAAQAKARQLAASRGVTIETVLADLAEWDWPEAAFDVVVGVFFQFCGPDVRRRIFAGIRRTLKDGGWVLIEGYRPEQLEYKTGGPSKIENLYTQGLLENSFGDWEALDVKAYDAEVNEGGGHVGMSALIDLVARKPALRR